MAQEWKPQQVWGDWFNVMEEPLDAYVREGVLWNGWACPEFTKEQADKVMEAINRHADGGDILPIRYDEATDRYIEDDSKPGAREGDWWEGSVPQLLPDGSRAVLYGIGSHCWTWSEWSQEWIDGIVAGSIPQAPTA